MFVLWLLMFCVFVLTSCWNGLWMVCLYGDVHTFASFLILLMCLDYDQFIHSWSENDGRTRLDRFQEMFKQNMAEVISEVSFQRQTETWSHMDAHTCTCTHPHTRWDKYRITSLFISCSSLSLDINGGWNHNFASLITQRKKEGLFLWTVCLAIWTRRDHNWFLPSKWMKN